MPSRSLGYRELVTHTRFADLGLLAALLATVAALAFIAGIATPDYFRFGAAFGAFLLPGWCLSLRLLDTDRDDSLPARLCFSMLLSYAIYAWPNECSSIITCCDDALAVG